MKRIGQNRLEWALLGLIAVACAALSLLQYHWTGEVSQAERTRLRSGLSDQGTRLARAFDNELRENCRALLPDEGEIREGGSQAAHTARYRRWAAAHDQGLFTRIGIAVPEQGSLRLFSLGPDGMSPIEWPNEWEPLRVAMANRIRGEGPPPSVPPNSTLIEFPIVDISRRRNDPRPEREWMIFEADQAHLTHQTLPRLIADLSAGEEAAYDISVSWVGPVRPPIYSTRPDHASVAAGADLTTGIFALDIAGLASRRQRPPGSTGPTPRWNIAFRHRDGSLDAVVSHARTRNLLTSLILIGLLGGTAWALVQYTARSRRLSEMQFRFAVGISHDLRTPLTAIRGAAFNLAEGVVTEPAAMKRYSKLILRNAEELTSMIENVLTYSASQHSSSQASHQTVSIGELLERAAAAMEQEAETAGCRIEVTVAPDLPPLAGDSVALELAFRNLIANAARHAAQGRWIGVSAARCAEGIEVRVCDRGPGVLESERERIFEPFYRGEHPRIAQVRGTGLGLSLVKDTVQRHRGSIVVHNSPAGGAQFTIRLPALPNPA